MGEALNIGRDRFSEDQPPIEHGSICLPDWCVMVLVSWSQSEGSSLDTDPARVLFDLGGVRRELDATSIGAVPFEDCAPVRPFPSWQRKRHYSGRFWMSRGERHVAFESLAERSCLLELDRLPAVLRVASQPMWIRWSGNDPADHAPDYFVRLTDGEGLLVDVRPRSLIDDVATRQFDRTAAFCAAQGWQYAVHDSESAVRDANLRFLSRYRDASWQLPDAGELPTGDLGTVAEVAAMLDQHGAGLARCYAFLWSGYLRVDFDQPLEMSSAVAREEAP